MFEFKKFSIQDDACTMKVGTDGVLVGAWADAAGAESILDIGTGCGLIALMMAQRSEKSRIDAVEIDPDSAEQARKNVTNSPWTERIRVINASVQDFCKDHPASYDLLISNPPFFENTMKPTGQKKNISKHTTSLTYAELLHHAAGLMHENSRFCVILPMDQRSRFTELALAEGLYCKDELFIIPREGKAPNRVILELVKQQGPQKNRQVTIRNSDGSYTEEYRRLTRDFYLHF